MPCEHSDYCVTCLRAELANVKQHRDSLLKGIEGLLSRVASKDWKPLPGQWRPLGWAPEGQTTETPALTPPDSPSRKEKADKAFVVSTKTHVFRSAKDGSFVEDLKAGETVDDTVRQNLELEAQVAGLDPAQHQALKPEAGPTVPYNSPWEAVAATVQNSAIAVEMMAEVAKIESRRKKSTKGKKSPKKPAPEKKSAQTPKAGKKPAAKTPERAKARANSAQRGTRKAPATKEGSLSPNEYLTTTEVEKMTGRAAHLVAVDCHSGKVPSIKSFAGKILLRHADVLKYASTFTKKAKAK